MDRKSHMVFTTSGATNVELLLSEDRLVRVYGETAIVTGRWVFTGTRPAGAVAQQRIRYLLVWVKRDGQWQIVAEQRTSGGR
jgi:ketosteroid isomerase-like protein